MFMSDPRSPEQTSAQKLRDALAECEAIKDDSHLRLRLAPGSDPIMAEAASQVLRNRERNEDSKRFQKQDERIQNIEGILKKNDVPEHQTKTYKLARLAFYISVATFLIGLARDLFDVRIRPRRVDSESREASPSIGSLRRSSLQTTAPTAITPQQTNAAATNPISESPPLKTPQSVQPLPPVPTEKQ